MADYGVRITLAAASPVPTYTAGPWASGVASLSSSSVAVGWSSGILIEVSAPGEQVDIASGGNYASVSDVDVVLFAGWVPAFEAAGASMYGAKVEVGTLSGTTLTVRWSGVVSDLGWRGTEYRITAESLITLRHREIPARILSGDEFAGLPSDAEGRVVPALYGAHERLTPASLQSERDYLAAMYVYAAPDPTQIERSTTIIGTPHGASPPTLTVVPIVYLIVTADGASPDRDFDDSPWWDEPDGTVYMEIFSGTGAGQVRRILTKSAAGSNMVASNIIAWLPCSLASPLDTLPDETSGIRLYLQPVGTVLAVGDEVVTDSVTAEVNGQEYPIGFAPGTAAEFDTADVSAEFLAGEDYSAIVYQSASSVFGISALSDGLTASAGYAATILPAQDVSVIESIYDFLCRGKIRVNDLPDSVVSESPSIAVMFSASTPAPGLFEVVLYGQLWDGTVERVQEFEFVNVFSSDRSTYSSAILPDGTPGNYASWAIPVTLSKPMAAYAELQFTAVYVGAIAANVSASPAITWTTAATSVVVSYDPTLFGIVVGDKIRPYSETPIPSTLSDLFMYGERGGLDAFGGDSSLWRGITGITSIGGGQWSIDLDAAISVPTGSYPSLMASASAFASVTMYECGLAFSFGAIPQDSQFLVSTSSGRTFDTHWTALPGGVSNGDPITDAAHIAQDVFLRDLAVPQADIGASYLTLPAFPARVALVDQEDSASILARMCREFNWIGAHDNAGRETLVAWLENLYALSADYAVTNADIVADSITGVDATSLDDIVTLPRASWDWTQADGFRAAGTVTDCSADPSTLTPTNYLRTISGFGDFATALAAYETLHESWKRNGVRRSESIEYRYGGTPTDLLLPARLEWSASRKDILQFKLNESHAAASAYLGQRIAVTHKRYTGGGTVYGTIVARYWFPEDGQIQLTVMLDPVDITAGDDLLVDTIDPTATIEQYTDEFDGVSEQYTDTLGA